MQDVLTWNTLVFSMAIFIFSLFLRRTLEAVFPTLSRGTPLSVAQKIWESVVLPMVPVVVGVSIAYFVSSWPYPEDLTSIGARVLYGAICGFFSTSAYRVLSALINKKFSVAGETVSDQITDSVTVEPPKVD